MHPEIHNCLRAATNIAACEDGATWWARHQALTNGMADPVALALRAGFAADRLGWAFASGYQAALRALLPSLPADTLAALCVTEAAGNRPRDMRTRIDAGASGRLRLDGAKRWATLGPESTLLLVVARSDLGRTDGEEGYRPQLKLLRVPVGLPGVTVRRMPGPEFIPEVPHAEIEFSSVELELDALVPGDAYDRYVKPFRTLEDVHVTLATLAYLLREAQRRQWPAVFRERLVATLAAFAAIAAAPPQEVATHLVLAGALRWAQAIRAEAETFWQAAGDDPAAQRWRRDLPVFEIAANAREARATRAWERLAPPVC